MKKMLMMVALILGVSAMAEDATTDAMATMKKEAKKVEEKMVDVKEDVKVETKKAEKKAVDVKKDAEEKVEAAKDDVKKSTNK